MERKDPLDANTRGDLAHGKRLVDPAAAPGNADALERLEALFFTFAHAYHDAHRVPGSKGGNVSPQVLPGDVL